MKILIIFLLFFSYNLLAREIGQTEITTDDGIEVFKKEKYYLLKKNVNIISDDFNLSADLVKVYFDKDLYDIVKINSDGNVKLKSSRGITGVGEKINFDIINEDIFISGLNSILTINNVVMKSDGKIMVNNNDGSFNLNGLNSNLKNEEINIYGFLIDGIFEKVNENNEVKKLYVEDDTQINIKTETLNMYSLKADYNKEDNIIELFDNVKIIRDKELITGDYAKINTINESYTVKSTKSKKVKILLDSKDE